MKAIFLMIISVALFTSSIWTEQSFADCDADVNYNAVLKNSELAFTGTVTRLDNYDGPQRVTFFIHDIIKGKVDTPKHVLENTGKVFLEDGAVRSSSIAVDYKIGKTYKVYVENDETTRCTTKLTAPPVDYLWEPGPEDGNYYSENPLYVDPCEEGYGLSDGVCITLEEMNKDLPTCSANPKHDFGKCKKNMEDPPNTFEQVKEHCDNGGDDIFLEWWDNDVYYNNVDCEILDRDAFGAAPPPELEPEPYFDPDYPCPPEKVLDWDICVDECPVGQIERNGICHSFENIYGSDDKLPWYFLIVAYWPVVVITLGIVIAVVYVWRKRK